MENFNQYKTDNGYVSPRNGKIYKSLKAFTAHWHNPGTGGWSKVNTKKYHCQYCKEIRTIGNIKKHEDVCYLNPSNIRQCQVCQTPIKDYKRSKGTCSHGCSNKLFKNLRNKPEKYTRYTTLCFIHHEKKCVVCGEDKIVAVHHYNENHCDNRPENLVPLCPTHHQYVHSRYKDKVLPIIDEYLKNFTSDWDNR